MVEIYKEIYWFRGNGGKLLCVVGMLNNMEVEMMSFIE